MRIVEKFIKGQADKEDNGTGIGWGRKLSFKHLLGSDKLVWLCLDPSQGENLLRGIAIGWILQGHWPLSGEAIGLMMTWMVEHVSLISYYIGENRKI